MVILLLRRDPSGLKRPLIGERTIANEVANGKPRAFRLLPDRALRAETGLALRERVVALHSLDHWADAVLQVISEVRSPRGTAGSAREAG